MSKHEMMSVVLETRCCRGVTANGKDHARTGITLGKLVEVPRFLIGKDSRGRWVAQDQQGLSGGLFVSQAEAVRYAMFESGRRPQAVIMVPGVLELDMTRDTAWRSQARRRAA